MHHDWSKHIDTRFHLIREYAHDSLIEVKFIRTDEQLGDILTKPLCKVKFKELSTQTGLQQIQYEIAQDLGGDLLNNSCACLFFPILLGLAFC